MCLYPVSIASLTDSYAVPLEVYHERGETWDMFSFLNHDSIVSRCHTLRGSPYVPSPMRGILFPSLSGMEWLSAVSSMVIKCVSQRMPTLLVRTGENVWSVNRWDSSPVQRATYHPSPRKNQCNRCQKKLLKSFKNNCWTSCICYKLEQNYTHQS